MKNAFSVFVFGNYDRFLPYYVYSIEKAYPEADVLIFYNAELSPEVQQYLDNKNCVTIYENFYAEHEAFAKYKIRGGGKKLLRHLIPSSYFEGYDHVYFGDVDILILEENLGLFNFHRQQATKSGVHFSNKVRPLPDGSLSKRLTGLHFVITQPYYQQMDAVIDRVFEDEAFREKMISQARRDEEFLYLLNKEASGFDPSQVANNVTPLHGIHLGNFRHGAQPNEDIKGYVTQRESMIRQLKVMMADAEFRKICIDFYCKEMARSLLYFEIAIPLALRLKYTFEVMRKKARTIIQKFKK